MAAGWIWAIIITVIVLGVGPFAITFIPVVGPVVGSFLRAFRSAIMNVAKPVIKKFLKIVWAGAKMIPSLAIASLFYMAGVHSMWLRGLFKRGEGGD